jgi:hypothetical protein
LHFLSDSLPFFLFQYCLLFSVHLYSPPFSFCLSYVFSCLSSLMFLAPISHLFLLLRILYQSNSSSICNFINLFNSCIGLIHDEMTMSQHISENDGSGKSSTDWSWDGTVIHKKRERKFWSRHCYSDQLDEVNFPAVDSFHNSEVQFLASHKTKENGHQLAQLASANFEILGMDAATIYLDVLVPPNVKCKVENGKRERNRLQEIIRTTNVQIRIHKVDKLIKKS